VSVATLSTTRERAELVVSKLTALGAPCMLHRIVQGPQILRVEVEPLSGTLMRKFAKAGTDLAFELGAESVRVQAPLPGRRIVAVDLPALERRPVYLHNLPPARDLCVPLGESPTGETMMLDIAAAPHVLIAGATGSGKSVCLNSILKTLLEAHTPYTLSVVAIDPKMCELTWLDDMPHNAFPVATDPDTACRYLAAVVNVMETRYSTMARLGVKTYDDANRMLHAEGSAPMSYVLVVIEELADLMMSSKKEVESYIARIGGKGRACGIHMIVATQSPVVAVVSGLVRANVPTRVVFSTVTRTDSQIALGQPGAELLLGKGDGFLSLQGSAPVRFQGAM